MEFETEITCLKELQFWVICRAGSCFVFIRFCMEECSVNSWVVSGIEVALTKRIVTRRYGGCTSNPTHICPGLVQGSPLPPVLFNIYRAVVASHTQETGKSSYICRRHFNWQHRVGQTMCNNVQETLQVISNWCEDTESSIILLRQCDMFL